MSLYPVSNDWANRELRQSNNRLLKLNILQVPSLASFNCELISRKTALKIRKKLLSLFLIKTESNFQVENVLFQSFKFHNTNIPKASDYELSDYTTS